MVCSVFGGWWQIKIQTQLHGIHLADTNEGGGMERERKGGGGQRGIKGCSVSSRNVLRVGGSDAGMLVVMKIETRKCRTV